MRSIFFFRFQPSFTTRALAAVLIILQLCTAPPALLFASSDSKKPAVKASPANKATILPDPTAGTKVNHKLPVVIPAKEFAFSSNPKDQEFAASRVFAEPLVPVGEKTTPKENKALAAALRAFAKAGNPEATQLLTEFLNHFPQSAWRASLLANLGSIYRSTGYWSKALNAWEEAWKLTANEAEPKGKALADYSLGELAQLNAKLGRSERLKTLFAQIGDRDVRGPATEKVAGAKQGLALMEQRPQDAYRCGPMALQRILAATNEHPQVDEKQIVESQSTEQGMSLVELGRLSARLGMKYQMAKRSPGAKVIVPSVINWKVGHYAALTKERNAKFLAQDPTFTDDVLVSQQAIDEEGSGYYLVPIGELPAGWQTVGPEEGQNIWGKGNAGANNEPPPPCVAPSVKCPTSDCTSAGMADYNVDSARVSLSINDTPVGYKPPRGPAINFTVSYQQREVAPVQTPTYSNLGNKWSFNWISYLLVDPADEAADAQTYGPGGGTLRYKGFNSTNQSYAPQLETQVQLVKTGTDQYEKHFPDGSKQLFTLSDGAAVYPRKLFMTQWIDPHGNAISYTYDASFRVIAVSDALGQVTTLSYELPADPLKVTKVVDPFGRRATLEYNEAGQLWKITDSIGLISEFTYGVGDFINKMTTPYGDTLFAMGETGAYYRWLEITDPQGAKERVEYNNDVPTIPFSDPAETVPPDTVIATFNSYVNYRNTYYWDKKAMAEASGDYTKARITHWLHSDDINVASDVPESVKLPLENRVWNNYPGQTWPGGTGGSMSNKRSKVARVLDDGTTQLYQYEYNSFGKVTKSTDPAGRSTTYIYDTNGIDLLEVHQTTAGMDELLAKYTYNSQHLPLTATDASAQITTYTYFPSGQVHTITNAKNEVTTYTYDTNGYLQNVVGATPGAITFFTYDGFGRLRTTTDSEGYTLTTDYDAIGGDPTKTMDRVAKITYPDGTYEQITYDRLDPEWMRDRLGRWSRKFYDALRHVVATQDPLNRIITYDWCICGSLEGITDPNGNTTSWIRDIQGRVTDKFYPDQTSTHYTYENTTSRLKTMTDAQGQSTNYTYFIDNNLQQVSYTNAVHPTPSVSYVYDPNFNRLLTMTDGTGVTTYSYNPIATPPTLGAGKVGGVDGPRDSDIIEYSYDELGRLSGSSINGNANATSIAYDTLGRTQSSTNPLGTFNYTYVNATGRLDHVDLPSGQKNQYVYFDNFGDHRLKQIKNLDPFSVVISEFDYTYSPVGHVLSWTQANSGVTNSLRYDFAYDAVDQLRSADLIDTGPAAVLKEYNYDYDPAGNRTNTQIGSAITSSSVNNLNQETGLTSGGKMHFRGTVNEPATVTVGGSPATIDAAGNFDGVANVNVGNNTVPVIATDASGNSRTNNYQINVPSGVNTTLLYDLNGNLTSDRTKTYEWDAVNRLIAINYSGTTNRTEFTYDGLSRKVKVVEKTDSTITSTKNLVWIGHDIAEERDASNSVTKRYYRQGFNITAQSSTSSYFYTRDHLDSIREVTDGNGTIQARYDYDPYGRRTKVSGMLDADFGFTNHYYHQPSGLHLALHRGYSADLGRWISRDPKENSDFLKDGPNLYMYVGNAPEDRVDPLGLASVDPRPPPTPIPGPQITPPRPPVPTPGPPPAPPPPSAPNCDCPPRAPADDQDNICSSPVSFLNANRCATQCCKAHDDCYSHNNCHWDSWLKPTCWPECRKCNAIAAVCVAAALQDPFCWIP